MKHVLATYMRLSLEDIDKRTNALKDDSNSITSQRSLIHRHLDQNPELSGWMRMEFCDDGFSGTNFERPAFQRMIEMIKRGEISCIVVKDLSRFGRNYIEVGDYLEHVFPFLGVRFMSINDHYDSKHHAGRTVGTDIALKNLMYDFYSKDLSRKVKSSMGVRQRACKLVNSVPYGYMVLPQDKHTYVPDPEAAAVIRRIFRDVAAGISCTEVAKMLNAEGVLTPSQYKNRKKNRADGKASSQWTHPRIHAIIRNVKYTGVMLNHTRESRYLRDKNQRRVPREEWYVKENAHEALVSQEEFERANSMIRSRKDGERKQYDKSDRVYYCGYCGRKLERENGTVFSCATHRYQGGSACDRIRFRIEDIEAKALAEFTTKHLPERKKPEPPKHTENRSVVKLRDKRIKSEIERCHSQMVKGYQDYKEGRIGRDDYLRMKDALRAQEEQLKADLEKVETPETTPVSDTPQATHEAYSAAEIKELMLMAVERIEVFADSEIRMKLKSTQNAKVLKSEAT